MLAPAMSESISTARPLPLMSMCNALFAIAAVIVIQYAVQLVI